MSGRSEHACNCVLNEAEVPPVAAGGILLWTCHRVHRLRTVPGMSTGLEHSLVAAWEALTTASAVGLESVRSLARRVQRTTAALPPACAAFLSGMPQIVSAAASRYESTAAMPGEPATGG